MIRHAEKEDSAMRKDKTNFASGFSIAELLISMTIAMIIAAALVPVVGPKKLTRPLNRLNHGIAECYYDVNGVLHSYYADDSDNSDEDKLTIEGNSCLLRVPKAAFYQVIVVGAGGNALDADFDAFTYSLRFPNDDDAETLGLTGNIYFNNFQGDINSASRKNPLLPGYIRNTLDEWAENDWNRNENKTANGKLRSEPNELFASYRLTSPTGAAGASDCRAVFISNRENMCTCNENTYNTDRCKRYQGSTLFYVGNVAPPGVCYYFMHGKGQNSGSGISASVRLPINGWAGIDKEINSTHTLLRSIVSDAEYSIELGLAEPDNNSEPDSPKAISASNGSNALYNEDRTIFQEYVTGATQSRVISDYITGTRTIRASSVNSPKDRGIEPAANSRDINCTLNPTEATEGSVKLTSERPLKWIYTDIIFNGQYAQKGGYGEQRISVFETLPVRLNLIPAANNQQTSRITAVVNNNETEILSANSGRDGVIRQAERSIERSSHFISSIVDDSYADNANQFGAYTSKLRTATARVARNVSGEPISNDCIASDNCPGYAGQGIYPAIDIVSNGGNVNIPTRMKITNENNRSSYSRVFNTDWSAAQQAETCRDGTGIAQSRTILNYVDPETGNTVRYRKSFCSGQPGGNIGKPGAVIVVW